MHVRNSGARKRTKKKRESLRKKSVRNQRPNKLKVKDVSVKNTKPICAKLPSKNASERFRKLKTPKPKV